MDENGKKGSNGRNGSIRDLRRTVQTNGTGETVPETPDKPSGESDLRSFLEAALLAASEPLSASEIGRIIDCDGTEVRAQLEQLKREYDEQGRGFQLLKVSGGFKLTTRERHYPWLRKMFGERTRDRISDAAMETLVIVAYHQPVIREEIENIRGVNCQSVLQTLMEKNFIRMAGRRDEIGRPIEYRTTEQFLDYFGLNTLNDLPDKSEIETVVGQV